MTPPPLAAGLAALSVAPGAPTAVDLAVRQSGRGIGVATALRDLLPTWAAAALATLTSLGDAAVLVALATLVYLAHDRRAGAFVSGTLLLGFGAVIVLKATFALPRPPADLQFVAAYGYGFPSGHAIGATVGWGAAALALEGAWSRRGRAAVAAGVVATVAVSRVAIGVHYLVDVVAGVAVGLALLAAAARWGRRDPLRIMVAAAGVAVVAVGLSGADTEAAALLGGTVGAATAWQVVQPADRPWGRPGVLASAGGGVGLLGGRAMVTPAASLAFGGGALAALAVFLAPAAASRWLGGDVRRAGPG